MKRHFFGCYPSIGSFAHRPIASCIVLAISLVGQRQALAAASYLADLPDFYQHQLSGSDAGNAYKIPAPYLNYTDPQSPSYSLTQPANDGGPGVQWERGGGWCRQVAFTDAFYQLDLHGASGLFNHGGAHTWLERMNYGISDFAIDTYGFGGATVRNVDQFAAFYVGAGTVKHDIYTWNAADSKVQLNGVNTAYTSMFTLYRDQIAADHNAVLTITNPAGDNPDWWWTGTETEQDKALNKGQYHTLAGAGYDNATGTIYFADPNDRGNGAATANWGFPYANNAALPVGAGFYGSNTLTANGTFGGAGDYAGTLIAQIDVLYVPEPATLGILSLGFIPLTWRRRRAPLQQLA